MLMIPNRVYEWSINPISNPNLVYSHPKSWQHLSNYISSYLRKPQCNCLKYIYEKEFWIYLTCPLISCQSSSRCSSDRCVTVLRSVPASEQYENSKEWEPAAPQLICLVRNSTPHSGGIQPETPAVAGPRPQSNLVSGESLSNFLHSHH
jgi:hypothetical protein